MRQLSLILLLLSISDSTFGQEITFSSEPKVGNATLIQVPRQEEGPPSIELIYRPGSQVRQSEHLGVATYGRLLWHPQKPGLIRVRAVGPSGEILVRDVAVRPKKPSSSGILVLLLAGGLLGYGAIQGFRYGR